MTNEEINIRIAEICGANKHVGLMKRGLWWRPDSKGYTASIIEAGRYTRAEAERIADSEVSIHEFPPLNYAGCLNACHEMEKTLSFELMEQYKECLGWEVHGVAIDYISTNMLMAHPMRRAMAFLRTHGKLEETKREAV